MLTQGKAKASAAVLRQYAQFLDGLETMRVDCVGKGEFGMQVSLPGHLTSNSVARRIVYLELLKRYTPRLSYRLSGSRRSILPLEPRLKPKRSWTRFALIGNDSYSPSLRRWSLCNFARDSNECIDTG